jgi:hypothetical protein
MNLPAPAIALRQGSFFERSDLIEAVASLANAGTDERGAIFTKREVVDFILDLCGYTVDRPLHAVQVLEPSFGGGDFLLVIIDRLLASWRVWGGEGTDPVADPVVALSDSIRAVELHRASFDATRTKVIAALVASRMSTAQAEALANCWLIHGDYLLADIGGPFDVVAGNPPYVRQELIPDVLLAEYRARYSTVYDRADIYIPFIERSLLSLKSGGQLGFICADRWMKNRYGGPLRRLVADKFHLKIYVDMVNTQAFHADVSAYPAITVIANEQGRVTRVARQPSLEPAALKKLADALLSVNGQVPDNKIRALEAVAAGAEPWMLGASDQLAVIRGIEERFPTLEVAGCKVGIGVATGADSAFIGPFEELDVEDDRKLPIVMTRDIKSGTVQWQGFGVINPFADEGGLVDLNDYPRLKRYLEVRKEPIAGRHCAQKSQANWYRTIDRITPSLAAKPKLLIPDIKGEAHIVFEDGKLYPHHNLYFVTSDTWNLRALQAVLQSRVTRVFIATYSTKMRGGFLRFQAQYLRRLRLPQWESVSPEICSALIAAAEAGDVAACDRAAFALYGLGADEIAVLNDGGTN